MKESVLYKQAKVVAVDCGRASERASLVGWDCWPALQHGGVDEASSCFSGTTYL